MCYYSAEKNWINEQFCVPFQSNLTADIVDEIISTGNCSLASLNEVFQIDKYLLPLFRNEIEKYLGCKAPKLSNNMNIRDTLNAAFSWYWKYGASLCTSAIKATYQVHRRW